MAEPPTNKLIEECLNSIRKFRSKVETASRPDDTNCLRTSPIEAVNKTVKYRPRKGVNKEYAIDEVKRLQATSEKLRLAIQKLTASEDETKQPERCFDAKKSQFHFAKATTSSCLKQRQKGSEDSVKANSKRSTRTVNSARTQAAQEKHLNRLRQKQFSDSKGPVLVEDQYIKVCFVKVPGEEKDGNTYVALSKTCAGHCSNSQESYAKTHTLKLNNAKLSQVKYSALNKNISNDEILKRIENEIANDRRRQQVSPVKRYSSPCSTKLEAKMTMKSDVVMAVNNNEMLSMPQSVFSDKTHQCKSKIESEKNIMHQGKYSLGERPLTKSVKNDWKGKTQSSLDESKGKKNSGRIYKKTKKKVSQSKQESDRDAEELARLIASLPQSFKNRVEAILQNPSKNSCKENIEQANKMRNVGSSNELLKKGEKRINENEIRPKRNGKPVKTKLFHPESVEEHVQRYKCAREREVEKYTGVWITGRNWTRKNTIPEPFSFATSERYGDSDTNVPSHTCDTSFNESDLDISAIPELAWCGDKDVEKIYSSIATETIGESKPTEKENPKASSSDTSKTSAEKQKARDTPKSNKMNLMTTRHVVLPTPFKSKQEVAEYLKKSIGIS